MSNNQQNEHLLELSIEDLFKSGDYIVPIYQRNYAWGEKEINQLIDDVHDYLPIKNEKKSEKIENDIKYKENNPKNYYIGSLVVYKKGNSYEVIDGQQRLTTLYILISVLKNKFEKNLENINFSLKFESREKSQKALEEIFKSNISPKDDLNTSIMNGYEIIEKRLKKLNEEDLKSFFSYLKEYVQILRVEVPQDTDLNHYFEIMNNRGEQLEKHEILKSRMLNLLEADKASTELFNTIWEACANMDKYVQYGFSTIQRTKIFGNNWNEFQAENFEDLKLGDEETKQSDEEKDVIKERKEPTIEHLITCAPKKNSSEAKQDNADTPERFNSVVNFPNFLLHVLKIKESESKKEGFDDKTVPLDDKKLLETFKGKYETKEEVKAFAYYLLKAKFLFDNYIIKRKYTTNGDEWSLNQLIINDNNESKNNTAYYKNRFFKESVGTEEAKQEEATNEKALMLLSMFHVSAPTMIYKHWLNAALKYLFEQFEQKQPISNSYVEYLEELAKAYMTDRYLSSNPKDYQEIIYTNNAKSQNNTIELGNLDKGTDVENFIFNYVDYLLWKENTSNYTNFSFAFRSSVEHYYPQNPMENIEKLKESTLNCFGNLCLVTNSENSRLSNFTPEMKKGFYSKQPNQSIKQKIMMKEDTWNRDAIKAHQEAMINLLTENLGLKKINA